MQRGELVLSDLDLEVREGEFVYLIGRVGSGKSSLLKILYADLQLVSGEGSVAGFDLRRLRRRDIPCLRRRMGIVFQDYQLLTDRNVFMNLYYVMKATGWKRETEIRQRIGEVLQVVRLESKSYKMPFELSGGEQQMLAMGRALMSKPSIILMDEPSMGLSPLYVSEIFDIIQEINKSGTTVLLVEQNAKKALSIANRAYVLETGKIVLSGDAHELMNNDSVKKAYLGE